MAVLLACSLFSAAFSAAPLVSRPVAPRAALLRMFEEPEKKPEMPAINQITRSREAGSGRTGSIAVTDGSGSFYSSRTLVNMLHDFGNFGSIIAVSDDVANAKKMLISRAARYSGMLDVLSFREGAAGAFDGAEAWLAIGPDEAALVGQIDAAVSAGVSRIFLLLSAPVADEEALVSKLQAADVEYTVMRTGPLVAGPSGTGLKLGALDLPVCEDVAQEDVFRFVTEALTLPEASNRAFSLCPSVSTQPALKEMRLCGYERRDEVQALLKGLVPDSVEALEAAQASEEGGEQLVMRSEAEVAAEREEELKMLIARAKQRGVEAQQKAAFEEAERLKQREEQAKYYSKADDDDEGGAGSETPTAEETRAEESKDDDKPDEAK